MEEVQRPVGKQEVGAAYVHAPEMKRVALILDIAGFKLIGAKWTAGNINVLFLHAKDHISRTVLRLSPATIPPTENTVRTGRALTHQQRMTGSVGDVGKANSGVNKKHPVFSRLVCSLNAQIRSERDPGAIGDFVEAQGSTVGWARVDRHDCSQAHVGRVVQKPHILCEGVLSLSPQVVLFNERQQPG